jgi:hypothetical protein
VGTPLLYYFKETDMVRMNDNFGENRKENSGLLENPRRCRIKEKWEGAGKTGMYYGNFVIDGGHRWAIVVWDDEDDPDLHKLGIEVATETWVTP